MFDPLGSASPDKLHAVKASDPPASPRESPDKLAADQQALARLRLLSEQLLRQIEVVTRRAGFQVNEVHPARTDPADRREMPERDARHDAREAQWERQMAAKVEAIGTLRLRLDQVQERQEQRVGSYLAEIEKLREHVAELSARIENFGRAGNTRARHHRRFSAHSTHAFVASLLSTTESPDFLRDAIMDAPIFTRTNYQPIFKAHPDGEYQLMEFMALHDRNFVRAAYLAILRRDPDPDGAAHYLAQVRSGENKAKLLDQLLRSEEGRQQHTVIHGLASHLKLTRLCELPLVGRMLEALLFLTNVRGHLRDLRVLENHVIRIAEEAQALHEANMIKLRSLSR